MIRPRVFVTRRLPGRALDRLEEVAETEVWPGELPPSYELLRERCASCHGLLTLLTDRIDGTLLADAPGLITISNMATGYDNIEVAAASHHNVLVTRTPGVLTETTADLAFALLLAAARRVVEGDSYVRRGQWRTWGPEILLGPDVHSATLGIVGLGRIGLAMAKRARGFNMRVIYYSRTPKPEAEKRLRLQYRPLEQLLVEADFVSLHAPLTEETYHLLGEAELARMKPGAILINTARGGLVDSRALYHALKEQRLAAAALDVTEEEPIDMGDPLLTLPNLVITPHIGSASIATRARMAELAVKNLLMALNGRIPRNAVNPEIAPAWRQARRLRLQGA